ncbi:WXG100 family type VII secretion target [Brachybacterium sp. YJGR34]|uniref:WXG100 family type VII secretion target n=1 Tax=Brachybacterium sp. YJGR34 TaxID=2059911 RepID=UPI000E0C2589|nr:hypothetical protein [Brachybacterium sp. YJGR34]
MAFKGMNPEQGREVASAIGEAGQQILEVIDQASSLVNSVEWVGPDYDAYREDWNGFVGGPVNSLIEVLQTKSDQLNQHAEEQDSTSNQG